MKPELLAAGKIITDIRKKQKEFIEVSHILAPGTEIEFSDDFIRESRNEFACSLLRHDPATQISIYSNLCLVASKQTDADNRRLFHQIFRHKMPHDRLLVPELWEDNIGLESGQAGQLAILSDSLNAQASRSLSRWTTEKDRLSIGQKSVAWSKAKEDAQIAWCIDDERTQDILLDGLELFIESGEPGKVSNCLSLLFSGVEAPKILAPRCAQLFDAIDYVEKNARVRETDTKECETLARQVFNYLGSQVSLPGSLKVSIQPGLKKWCPDLAVLNDEKIKNTSYLTEILDHITTQLRSQGTLGQTICERIHEKKELLESSTGIADGNSEVARQWLRNVARLIFGQNNLDSIPRPFPSLSRFCNQNITARLPKKEIENRLEEFKRSFMDEVVGGEEIYRQLVPQLRRALLSDTSLTVITFHGPPGTMKTSIAKLIQKTIFKEFSWAAKNLAGHQSTAVLAGSDPVWQGAKRGELSKILTGRKDNRTCFFFDELSRAGERNQNLLATLLENGEGPGFEDEYFGFPMDFRGDVFIFATNDFNSLLKHLQSRLSAHLLIQTTTLKTEHYHEIISRSWEDAMKRRKVSWVNNYSSGAFTFHGKEAVRGMLSDKESIRELKATVENICNRFVDSTLRSAWNFPLTAIETNFLKKQPWAFIQQMDKTSIKVQVGFFYNMKEKATARTTTFKWSERDPVDVDFSSSYYKKEISPFVDQTVGETEDGQKLVVSVLQDGKVTTTFISDNLPTRDLEVKFHLLEPTDKTITLSSSSYPPALVVTGGLMLGQNGFREAYPDTPKSITDLHPDEQMFRLEVSIKHGKLNKDAWKRWQAYYSRVYNFWSSVKPEARIKLENWADQGFPKLPEE